MSRAATPPRDTIAAVSSPPGRSPRALIRIAGDQLRTVLRALIDGETPTTPRTLHRVRLKNPRLPALLTTFAAPASYTGDDLAELQVVGHPALLERLLQQTIRAGARLAEPGEFTFRAFTAGKLDLTQAEGIAATIAAISDSQLAAASLLREGKLGTFAASLVDELGNALALVEAGIDFVDQEDVVPVPPPELDARLQSLAAQLHQLLQRSRSWGALEALPRVVLVGPPSTGKSTLFNALLGRPRAVIDPAPGTTRDVLIEPMTLTAPTGQTVEVELVDIAGLDRPSAALDEQVQAAAQRAIAQADLILAVNDAPTANAPPIAPPVGATVLHVRTRIDQHPTPPPDDTLPVSAHTGAGLDTLRRAIAQRIGARGVSVAAEMLALQPRHEQALRNADHHLAAARDLLAPQRDAHQLTHTELIAGEMRSALDALASLGGRLSPDDVLGRVFATFCIGK
ncbi:MAG: tRNA modification GTPase [Phycisphaeraceae bacterium]